eukprot:111059_1
MSQRLQEIFHGRASVYALDQHTKQWADRGTSGSIIMYNHQNTQDVGIIWQKNEIKIWWKLTGSKLKPKDERALILKALVTVTNQQEILAIRFSNQESATQSAKQYHYI